MISAGSDHSVILVASQTPKTLTLGEQLRLVASSPTGTRESYQWQLNGRNLEGATNATLSVDATYWTNAGSYRIVLSNAFGVTTSAPTVVSVTRTPLRFDPSVASPSSPARQFPLRMLGASGVGPVVIYASTNLVSWSPIFTNPPTIGAFDYLDGGAAESPQRFYRAAEMTVTGPIRIDPVPAAGLGFSGGFPLQVTGLAATGKVIIYSSTNLLDWTPVFTNPPTIGPLYYTEPPVSDRSPRFYRASETR